VRIRLLPTLIVCALAFGAGPVTTLAQTATVAPADRKAAIELFKQSRAAYQAGRFDEAANLLRRAYALDPAPTLLYNLARALESDGDIDGAADAYRRYLEADPSAKDRAAIEKRIANLDAQMQERDELRRRLEAEKAKKQAPAPSTQVVTTPEPEPAGPSAVPWVLAGVGGGALVAGAVLGGLAQSAHGDAEDAASMLDAVDADDRARGLARGANIAFGVGGALAAAGLVWGIIDVAMSGGGEPEEDGFEASLRLGPVISPNQVGIVGRF